MEIPSPGRVLVEMQKATTRAHRALLQSPAAPLLARLPGGNVLVLHTTGRKSGKHRETPLTFTRDGDAWVVIASDGGAAKHPDWYMNLSVTPNAEVEVGGRRTPVVAETVEGPYRDRLWRRAARSFPGYEAYQSRTAREIPVVRLEPVS